MPLASPKLPLPPSHETKAFRAFEKVLRSDVELKKVVKTWSTWDGEAIDFVPPSPAMCPYLQLTPLAGPARRETEGHHKVPMFAAVFLAVQGSDVDQLANLWAAVRLAVFPQDPGRAQFVHETLKGALAAAPAISEPAYGLLKDGPAKDAPFAMLSARGLFSLTLHVAT